MDADEEKRRESHRTSQSSSIRHPLVRWRLPNNLENTSSLSLAQSFYAKHTQQSPKNSKSLSHDDVQNHVAERRFSGFIPLDVVWKILSRLPAKSVVRFRSVSKLWSSFTTNPYFINSFPALPSVSSPCLLLIFQTGTSLFVISFPQHQNLIDPYSQVERYEVTNPYDCHLACSYPVYGLILFETTEKLVIWNPTMRRFLPLRKPKNSFRRARVLLGYDPIECKHKVLSFCKDAKIHVLTLGAQESWRMVEASPMHYFPIAGSRNGRCINGIIYYKTCVDVTLKNALIIMSFDVRLETFSLIEPPMDGHINVPCLMIPYEGKLALVNPMATSVEIWILEDAENQTWSYKLVFYPPSDKEWMTLHLNGVTSDGELVYTPRIMYESFLVVYFDLKKKSIRETKIEGIPNDIFRRFQGHRFGTLNDFDVFPNHIESLLSSL